MTDVDLEPKTPKGLYVVVGYPNSPEYNQVDLAQRQIITNPLQVGALPQEKAESDPRLG